MPLPRMQTVTFVLMWNVKKRFDATDKARFLQDTRLVSAYEALAAVITGTAADLQKKQH